MMRHDATLASSAVMSTLVNPILRASARVVVVDAYHIPVFVRTGAHHSRYALRALPGTGSSCAGDESNQRSSWRRGLTRRWFAEPNQRADCAQLSDVRTSRQMQPHHALHRGICCRLRLGTPPPRLGSQRGGPT